MDYPKELLEIFDDPLLDDVRPLPKRITSDERVVTKFQEITDWVKENNRLPSSSGSLKEKLLAKSLETLKNEFAEALKQYDELNILDD